MIGEGGVEITGEVQYLQPIERVIPTRDPGRRVEPMGVIHADDLHIFLTEAILRRVVDWSKSDLEHELGGVFVGELCSHQGQPWLDIAGYVQAQHYEHTAASFKFTHDSWSAISRECEQKFGDKPRVGWHHTHPGYGIFLSGTDMFSHRSFFNLPWMFALVVDPRAESLGFFQWKRGKVEKVGFFFVR